MSNTTKALLTLLTSSNIEALRLSYATVKQQINPNIQFDIIIVVNTLDNDYYSTVVKRFPDAKVMRTESNGKPGKGHNSLLEIFKQHTDYQYLIPIDGDDILYPYAIHRLGQYLKYKPDAIILPYNDNVSLVPPTTIHLPIQNRFYFTFNNYAGAIINQWKSHPSPFQNDICNLTTPGRVLLLSRKATLINLTYNNDLKWYDDYQVFLQLYEASHIYIGFNTYVIDDKDIYLYNMINQDSVSNSFKQKFQENSIKENLIFKQSIKHKYLLARSWELNTMKILRNDTTDGFTIYDKVKFINSIAPHLSPVQTNFTKDTLLPCIDIAKRISDQEMLALFTFYHSMQQSQNEKKDNLKQLTDITPKQPIVSNTTPTNTDDHDHDDIDITTDDLKEIINDILYH